MVKKRDRSMGPIIFVPKKTQFSSGFRIHCHKTIIGGWWTPSPRSELMRTRPTVPVLQSRPRRGPVTRRAGEARRRVRCEAEFSSMGRFVSAEASTARWGEGVRRRSGHARLRPCGREETGVGSGHAKRQRQQLLATELLPVEVLPTEVVSWSSSPSSSPLSSAAIAPQLICHRRRMPVRLHPTPQVPPSPRHASTEDAGGERIHGDASWQSERDVCGSLCVGCWRALFSAHLAWVAGDS
jgi:hypothetical protein